MEQADVVVVGGGIAGSALGTVLARAGLDVVVLEQVHEFDDRIRGEALLPWGVAEAQTLGLLEILTAAGGHLTTSMVTYDEGRPPEENPQRIPLDLMAPGSPGSLNVQHPIACRALADAARAAGATVVMGAQDVAAEAEGDGAVVRWQEGGTARAIQAPVLVGADGRASGVRRTAGIELHKRPARVFLAGLLVDGLDLADPADDLSVLEGDRYFLAFPQSRDRARLYLGIDPARRAEFAGAGGPRAFLDECRFDCAPDHGWSAARPAGPCGAFPGEDTWTDRPAAGPVVLVGDAAGYSNPLAGQGLSIALRDVRLASEAILGGEPGPARFDAYAQERARRMRRLHFTCDLQTRLFGEFGPGVQERRAQARQAMATDARCLGALLTLFAGPDAFGDDTYTDEVFRLMVGEDPGH